MAKSDTSLDAAIDELYTADLDEFVARRDQLARELRGGGDRDAATQVKQLKKPSRVAWAVNQAARRAPEQLDAVLRTGRALRDAQQRALREGASPVLHEAVRERQRAVRALADVAIEALGLTGATARDAIEQTLNAASIDDEAAEAVRAARLTTELEPPDVFAALDVGPGAPTARSKPATSVATKPPAREQRSTSSKAPKAPRAPTPAKPSERARAAAATAKEARREADAAERERARAEARAEELAQRARDAAARADDARRAAREATERARDARRRAERAEEAARRAGAR